MWVHKTPAWSNYNYLVTRFVFNNFNTSPKLYDLLRIEMVIPISIPEVSSLFSEASRGWLRVVYYNLKPRYSLRRLPPVMLATTCLSWLSKEVAYFGYLTAYWFGGTSNTTIELHCLTSSSRFPFCADMCMAWWNVWRTIISRIRTCFFSNWTGVLLTKHKEPSLIILI